MRGEGIVAFAAAAGRSLLISAFSRFRCGGLCAGVWEAQCFEGVDGGCSRRAASKELIVVSCYPLDGLIGGWLDGVVGDAVEHREFDAGWPWLGEVFPKGCAASIFCEAVGSDDPGDS